MRRAIAFQRWAIFIVCKGVWSGLYFKLSKAGFSTTGCLTKTKEPSLPYQRSIAGTITFGFMLFQRVSAWSETRTASSNIWTRITDSIFCVYTAQSAHLFIVRRKKDSWIHTNRKGISNEKGVLGTKNSLFHDLNSGHRAYFFRR